MNSEVSRKKPAKRPTAKAQRSGGKAGVEAEPATTANAGGATNAGANLSALEWCKSIEMWPSDPKNDPELLFSELVRRFNDEHGAVAIGTTTKYTRMGHDETGRAQVEFWSAQALREYYRGCVVQRTARKTVTAFDYWAEHPDRHYFTGVVFAPGSEVNPPKVPDGALNLWQGYGVKPREGDWSLFRKHLHGCICDGNTEHFEWVMDWMADLIQNPQEKRPTCVVIRSKAKGVGKSMLGGFLSKIFGHHAAKIGNKEQLFGKFNALQATSIFTYLEETTFAGSPVDKTRLRDKVSETEGVLERKGIDPVPVRIYTQYMIFANENHVVPVDLQERRYFVLDVQWDIPDRNDKVAYFEPIWRQMEVEGGIEAMMHELMHRKVTRNLFIAPRTAALAKQEEYGLPPDVRVLVELVRLEELPKEDAVLPSQVHRLRATTPTDVPTRDLMAALDRITSDRRDYHTLRTSLGELLQKLGVQKLRKWVGQSRPEFYRFPPLHGLKTRMIEVLQIDPSLIMPTRMLDGGEDAAVIPFAPHRPPSATLHNHTQGSDAV